MKLAIALLLVVGLVAVSAQRANQKRGNKKAMMRRVRALVAEACPDIEACDIPNMPMGAEDKTCRKCLKRCVMRTQRDVAMELRKCFRGLGKLAECKEAKKCGRTCFMDNIGERDGIVDCFSSDCCDTFNTCHLAKCEKKAECLAPVEVVEALATCAETDRCQQVCGGVEDEMMM